MDQLFGPHPTAADASPEMRPGVPMQTPPTPLPGSEPALTDRQQSDVEILLHVERHGQRPVVYSTAYPPSGVNGAIRRLAYRYPDHMARKWLLLMVADQVGARGAQLKKVAPLAVGFTLLALVGGGLVLGRRS